MSNPRGYDYPALLAAVAERDEGKCFGFTLLVARRQAKIDEWAGGQATGLDPACRADWIPASLMRCELPWDAHHWLEKSWIKSHERTVAYQGLVPFDLAAVLNDPRDTSLICRRHHDLIGNRLVVVRRGDLPEHVEEFAEELGPKATARLERDFGPRVPTSLIELARGEG